MDHTGLSAAFTALDDSDAALTKLDKMCCDPGRSPSMKALDEALAAVRYGLDGLDEHVIARLEDAGAQVGRLQVGCCAPKRLPLYARILENLTTIQLTVNAALGRGH